MEKGSITGSISSTRSTITLKMSKRFNLTPLPDKEAILAKFKGTKIQDLPTPSFLINKNIFTQNCESMYKTITTTLGCDFRPHVKTHKTKEGVELQLLNGKTKKIVVSTLAEIYGLTDLIDQGLINDILYSLPPSRSLIPELYDLNQKVDIRLMVDDIRQLKFLINYSKQQEQKVVKPWYIFVKIDMGDHRAGFQLDDPLLVEFLTFLFNDKDALEFIELFGFYAHHGGSYKSKDINEANDNFSNEIKHVNEGCKLAKSLNPKLDVSRLTLSVGATPTIHSVKVLNNNGGLFLKNLGLIGKLESHGGNYCCCDLQQLSTKCITKENISVRVLSQVVSSYPLRHEMLINSGVLSLTKEQSAIKGFGQVNSPYEDWFVGRISQEHGILTSDNKDAKFIEVGENISIIPQHACIAAACNSWYFIVDDFSDNGKVVDVWVPFRGW